VLYLVVDIAWRLHRKQHAMHAHAAGLYVVGTSTSLTHFIRGPRTCTVELTPTAAFVQLQRKFDDVDGICKVLQPTATGDQSRVVLSASASSQVVEANINLLLIGGHNAMKLQKSLTDMQKTRNVLSKKLDVVRKKLPPDFNSTHVDYPVALCDALMADMYKDAVDVLHAHGQIYDTTLVRQGALTQVKTANATVRAKLVNSIKRAIARFNERLCLLQDSVKSVAVYGAGTFPGYMIITLTSSTRRQV